MFIMVVLIVYSDMLAPRVAPDKAKDIWGHPNCSSYDFTLDFQVARKVADQFCKQVFDPKFKPQPYKFADLQDAEDYLVKCQATVAAFPSLASIKGLTKPLPFKHLHFAQSVKPQSSAAPPAPSKKTHTGHVYTTSKLTINIGRTDRMVPLVDWPAMAIERPIEEHTVSKHSPYRWVGLRELDEVHAGMKRKTTDKPAEASPTKKKAKA